MPSRKNGYYCYTMTTSHDEPTSGSLTLSSGSPALSPMDGAMQTGTGADDEPEMLVGDRHTGDASIDPDGDGVLTMAEAAEILGSDTAEHSFQDEDTEKETT